MIIENVMKISAIKVKNLKKIIDLDINVPEGNQVICFVGENGSNKSTLITHLYQLIRRTSKETSPSDQTDTFLQGTSDIRQGADESYYSIKVSINEKKQTYSTSEASIGDFDSLSSETVNDLKTEFKRQYNGKNQFLQNSWSISNPNADDVVGNNVLLFRPSNRFEVPSYETSSPTDISIEPIQNTLGLRKFPFRVETGIAQASKYFLDVILDFFIDMNNQVPTFSLYNEFSAILSSIDKDFEQLTISRFPNKSLSSKNLPGLNSLSSGQSDWLVTAINILIQISELASKSEAANRDPFEISGIVFIDEVDKNYHPKLQEEIIPWLTEKFSKIQFIISTHSPYLVRSLAENSLVIKLPDGDILEENFSYWDINEVTRKLFLRDLGFSKKVNDEISAFKKALSSEDNEKSLEIYNKLIEKSDSLRSELNTIAYTRANQRFLEVINENR